MNVEARLLSKRLDSDNVLNQRTAMNFRLCRFCVPAIAALLFAGPDASTAAGKNPTDVVPLKLYWNQDRSDYFDTSSAPGEKDAKDGGYEFVRIEAFVFATAHPGTVPLKLYWNPGRHEQDYFVTATSQAENDVKSAGYQFVRVVGYVYSSTRADTVP
jgi:hypothetical protein